MLLLLQCLAAAAVVVISTPLPPLTCSSTSQVSLSQMILTLLHSEDFLPHISMGSSAQQQQQQQQGAG
jgi:hypothetical protein